MKCRVLTAKDCRANRNCVVFLNLAAWGISAASNYDVKKKKDEESLEVWNLLGLWNCF